MWLLVGCGTTTSVGGGDEPAADTGDTGTAPADTATEQSEEATLCVNEFMPENDASVADETNQYPDWIELHNYGDAPVALDGWGLTDDRADAFKHTLAGGMVLGPSEFLLLWADSTPELGDDHLGFSLSADGGDVGLFTPEGSGIITAYGWVDADFSVARTTDCCTGEGCFDFVFRGTPGITNEDVVTVEEELLSAGSTWRYYDSGESPGARWAEPSFDDSAWAEGAGPLGYGDKHQVTTVSYGDDASLKHITTWFRTSFTVEDAAGLYTLTLQLLRDDAAVVYVGGEEVVRDNIAEGELTAETLATSSVGDADETTYWSFEIDPAVVADGENVVAVELHQSAADSSDLGFDLAIVAERIE